MQDRPARVALFYSDVSGFSAMTERLGDALAFDVMTELIAVLRALALEHGGREIEVRGDACLLTFASAEACLDFAIDVQRALARRRVESPTRAVALRIGLHAGRPIAHDEGIFGRDVIVAARLADACPPNAILVSSHFRKRLRDPRRIGRERRVALKGLAAPEPVARVYWGARSPRRGGGRGALDLFGSWCARTLGALSSRSA